MGIDEKARQKKDQVAGSAKERVGDAADDRSLQTKGRAQKAKGNLKQAGEKAKDAFKK